MEPQPAMEHTLSHSGNTIDSPCRNCAIGLDRDVSLVGALLHVMLLVRMHKLPNREHSFYINGFDGFVWGFCPPCPCTLSQLSHFPQ